MDFDLERLEEILSPYIVLRKDGRVVYVSGALAARSGLMKDEIRDLVGARIEALRSNGSKDRLLTLPAKGREDLRLTFTNTMLRDTEVFSFSEHGCADREKDGEVIPEVLATMAMFTNTSCLIVEKGHIIHANDAFSDLVGYPSQDIRGKQIIGFISRQSREEFIKACDNAMTLPEKHIHPADFLLTSRSGRQIFISMTGGWHESRGRNYLWLIMDDMTEIIGLRKTLKEEEQKFSDLYDLSPLGLLYVNPRGIILNCNEYVYKLMGYNRDEIFGFPFTKFVVPHEEKRLRQEFKNLFAHGEPIHRRECLLRTKDGDDITIKYDVRAITRKRRNIMALMVFSNITEKKELEMELLEKNAEMEKTLWEMTEVKDALEARAGELNRVTEELKVLNEKLNQLSITDGLTEIYNHRHFQDRLTEEVERTHRSMNGVVSLLILDIDDFKRFNDTYGHQCGDMVLKQLAGILRNNVRTVDILARYGGEEFAVVLPNTHSEEAVRVAERICKSVRSTPFSFGGGTSVKVTVSIGVGSLFSGQGEKSDLIRKADNALYAAKAKWKDRVEVWEEED